MAHTQRSNTWSFSFVFLRTHSISFLRCSCFVCVFQIQNLLLSASFIVGNHWNELVNWGWKSGEEKETQNQIRWGCVIRPYKLTLLYSFYYEDLYCRSLCKPLYLGEFNAHWGCEWIKVIYVYIVVVSHHA